MNHIIFTNISGIKFNNKNTRHNDLSTNYDELKKITSMHRDINDTNIINNIDDATTIHILNKTKNVLPTDDKRNRSIVSSNQNFLDPLLILSKNLERDYILFDKVDDYGNYYRYGVFAVFSSFISLDENGEYLDPTKKSNVCDITRVLTVKTLIRPEFFGSNIRGRSEHIGKPEYISNIPVIEFLETTERPSAFVDIIFEYNNGGARSFRLKKNTRKIVERDNLENVVDPLDTQYNIESAISDNQNYYDRHINDLYYVIVNMNYISSTRYELLMQTILVMLGI